MLAWIKHETAYRGYENLGVGLLISVDNFAIIWHHCFYVHFIAHTLKKLNDPTVMSAQ